jgi:hypothetical protein
MGQRYQQIVRSPATFAGRARLSSRQLEVPMLNHPGRFPALAAALCVVLGIARSASAQASVSETVRARLLNVALVAKWAKPTCGCYFSKDCPQGQTCGDYFTCTQSGKLDGPPAA